MVSLESSSMQLYLPEGWLRNCQNFYVSNAQLEQCSSARHSLSIAQKNLLEEHYQWDSNLTFQFNETVDYRLPLSQLTSLNIGCTRHSQASLTLLSFARYFGIIQTSLASALAAPSVHSCVSISIHSRRNPNALLVWMIQYSVRSLLLGLFSPHLWMFQLIQCTMTKHSNNNFAIWSKCRLMSGAVLQPSIDINCFSSSILLITEYFVLFIICIR